MKKNIMSKIMYMFAMFFIVNIVSAAVSAACVDSDNGLDYYKKGSADNRGDSGVGAYYQDKCLQRVEVAPNSFVYKEAGKCRGDLCNLQEAYCSGDAVTNIAYTCPNGCIDGACVPDESDEDFVLREVVCEIDYNSNVQEDVDCYVEYNGTAATCTIPAASYGAHQCVPQPEIRIPTPVGASGFSPVYGLGGYYAGIACDKIETAFNGDRYFFNCLNSNNGNSCAGENQEVFNQLDFGPTRCCDGLVLKPYITPHIPEVNGICVKNTRCAAEGTYNSGPVSPEYYVGCCDGLSGYNTHPGTVGGRELCYDPNKGNPVCQYDGTGKEGWYYTNGQFLLYEDCGTDAPICREYLDQYGCTVTECTDGKRTVNCDGKYVKLDEKFELMNKQSATVVNYQNMKITLNEMICSYACSTEGGCSTMCDATVTVEMPPECSKNGGGCTVQGKTFEMKEGASEEVFGAKLSFLTDANEGKAGIFTVQDSYDSRNYVETLIYPAEQTIKQGESAKYVIKIMDGHPRVACPEGMMCEAMPSYIYYIKVDVGNAPLSLNYQNQVILAAGQEKEIELTVTHDMTKEIPVSTTGQTYREYQQMMNSSVKYQQLEVAKELLNGYKFIIRTVQANDANNQDVDYAVLYVDDGITPPPFPEDYVNIKLYKGWNIISLPGEAEGVVDANGNSVEQKLVAFIYYKGKYVNLKDAEKLFPSQDALEDYLARNAFWVYSPVDAILKVRVGIQYSYSSLELHAGYNFVPITKDMVGKSLDQIKGTCNLERLYLWESLGGYWNLNGMNFVFQNDLYARGVVVKVTNDCRFADNYQPMQPPELPLI